MSRGQRLLTLAEVVARTSLSASTVYRLRAKGRFPAPVQLSANRMGFYEADIEAWMDAPQNWSGRGART